MKAMILAAGRGTRLAPYTLSMPKPMVPLIRKPVMESIIERLHANGIDDIVINTSYLAKEIEGYFGDGSRYGVNIGYSFEGSKVDGQLVCEALGSAGGMAKVQKQHCFFDDTFVVLCGDAYIDLDFTKAIEFHNESGAIATIILKEVPRDQVSKYGVVLMDESSRIIQFQEKPSITEAVSTTINTGIYIFDPRVFDYIPTDCEFDIGSDLFPELVRVSENIKGFKGDFTWLDIGNVKDLFNVSLALLEKREDEFGLPGKDIGNSIRVGLNVDVDTSRSMLTGPIYIGSGSVIEPGVTIKGPAIIGRNCHIHSGTTIDHSMLGDYLRVRGPACVRNKMVFDDSFISSDGEYWSMSEAGLNWLIDDVRCEPVANAMPNVVLHHGDNVVYLGRSGK